MPITGELVIDYKGSHNNLMLPKIIEQSPIREDSSDNLHGFMFHMQNMKRGGNKNHLDESSAEVDTGRNLLQTLKRGLQQTIEKAAKSNQIAPISSPNRKESLKAISGKIVNVEVEKVESLILKKSQLVKK